jgi:hypothetical protein
MNWARGSEVIVAVLRVLHEMNATIDDILTDSKDTATITSEPLAQFINRSRYHQLLRSFRVKHEAGE